MERNDFSKGTVWSILPGFFESLVANFRTYSADADMQREASKYKPSAGSDGFYKIENGVAIIPIHGSITKRPSFFSFLYGGTSIDQISASFQAAMNDPAVQAVVLDMDSPGGTVSGVDELSEKIYAGRGKKPIVAYAGSMMASAAYWIGSAADRIIAAKTADIGSIGVLMMHADWSEYDKKVGIKTTYITAGKYKALGNDAEPLSEFARETFQSELNYIYDIFLSAVGRNRGVESKAVKENMADGRIFIGQQALEAGLIDSIGNMQAAIETANTLFKGGQNMEIKSVKELRENFSSLVEQIEKSAKDEANEVGGKISAKMVEEEQDRIIELANVHFGPEAGGQFKTIVTTGVTVDQYKAIKGSNPAKPAGDDQEAARQAAMLAAIQAAGPANPGSGDGAGGDDQDFLALVESRMAETKGKKSDAIAWASTKYPKARAAYLKKMQ
jgi:signal peptide peptidase SppA